jgi:hypothetical protein
LWIVAALRSPSAAGAICIGDCNGDGAVRIEELLTGINVALGHRPVADCTAFGCGDGTLDILVTCAVAAVTNALVGCPAESPTPTSTAMPAPSRSCTLTRTPSWTRTGTRTATRSVTPTCPPAPPPSTCPAGSVIACAHPYCSIDCGCGTVTPTPTPTKTCTPGANPAPGCAYEGPTFTATHSPCHGAPTPTSTPAPPALELTLDVVPLPDERRVVVVGTIRHRGGSPVSYRSGCTARCRPAFYEPISFTIAGPDGSPVLIDAECMGPYLCPEGLDALQADFSETTTMSLTGTALAHTETYPGECFTDCLQQPLAAGRYVVTARFVYWVGVDRNGPQGALEVSADVAWPP